MTQPKMITGYFLDPTNPRASGVRTIPATLEAYYDLLGCSCIDIVSRKIGTRNFDIVCDDEALLRDDPIPSAVSHGLDPVLYGALFVAKFDGVDDLTSLTDDDAEYIAEHRRGLSLVHDGELTPIAVLCHVSY